MRQGVAEPGHVPVLLDETVEALSIRADGIYLDGTFGRGGHSAAILARLGDRGRLMAMDRDPQAVEAGNRWGALKGDARFSVTHGRFAELADVLAEQGFERIDGVLFDLGVSSPQIDDAGRGFSFREDGPLDMRMDPSAGLSARQWLMTADEQEIAEVVREYGEERFAIPIAKAIVARVRHDGDAALQTTRELASLVANVVRSRRKKPEVGKDPATRTFQAVRIFINQELAQLEGGLNAAVACLRPGGRLVVISFHSLEDRMVKQFIARESGRDAPRDPIRGGIAAGVRIRLRSIGRVLPSDAEREANPRARSAVLRVAERCEEAPALDIGAASINITSSRRAQ